MIHRRNLIASGLAFAAAPPALAAETGHERDRRAILAMTGDYQVRFDFRETTAFVDGYVPIKPTQSGGYEVVRAIADRPGFISLQHMLVVDAGGETMVVKHWRQDWTFQPMSVLSYDRANHWSVKPVKAADRAGAWSQTVWQTDDSPRYGGTGRWSHADGLSIWASEETDRPLARRDAVRKPPYDHYRGINRHALTPTGWIHEQANAKIGIKDGRPQTFVHETVLNTYNRSDKFSAKPADDYWAATRDYWALVRAAWEASIARGKGRVAVVEEPQNGSITGPRLMELADEIAEAKTTTAKAAEEARAVIASAGRTA